ncbi:MAG: hypothetical protein GY856_14305 [bacterium]|nr:hypothetical protein [bacterium]
MESFEAVVSTILERIRANQSSGTGSRRPVIPPGVRGVGYAPYRCTPTTWGVQETAESHDGTPAASAGVATQVQEDPPGKGRDEQSRRPGTRKRVAVELSGVPVPRGLLST